MAGKNSVFIDNSAPAVDAGWLNIIQTEENNIITTSGQSLSDSTLNQQATGIASYAAQGSVFGTDSGAADAYVFTQISPFLKPYALKNGMTIKFRPGNANTGGACTVNACAFGSKSVKAADGTTNPPINSLNTSTDAELRYNGTVFVLTGTSASPSLPAGAIMSYARSTAPSGWLECDGSAISRTINATLFAAVGTTFGVGNGTTTFNIPDLRGQFIRGWAHGGSVDSGRVFGSNQTDDNKPHTHVIYGSQNASAGGGDPSYTTLTNVSTSGNNKTSASSGSTESRPVNVALMYCIKT